MAETLKKLTNLKKLDFSDIIAGRPEEEALKVLETLCSAVQSKGIIDLDLSDNALGLKGVNSCSALLRGQENLEALRMNNDGIAAEAAEKLVEILLERQPTKLKLVHCVNNLLNNGGAKALAKLLAASPDIEDIFFSATRFGVEGGLALSESLLFASKLQHVNLSDNTFSGKAAPVLAQALQKQTKLRTLVLNFTGLGDAGVKELASKLESAVLETLDLSGNDITSQGAHHVVKLVKPSLIKLHLDDNELESSGAKIIAAGIETTNLRELHMSTNSISQIGGIAIVKSVIKLQNLQVIELNANKFKNLDAMKKILKNAEKLHCLGDTTENEDDDDEEEEEEEEEVEEDGTDEAEDLTEQMKNIKIKS